MIEKVDGRNKSFRTKSEIKEEALSVIKSLSPNEREAFVSLLGDIKKGDMAMYEMLCEVEYKHAVVGIKEWLEDPYYFGNVGENVYPVLKDDLIELFSGNYHEAILSGSIGFGKTYISCIAICRLLYELSCYRNPQQSLGLSGGSTIAIAVISTIEKLAKKVVFDNLGAMINQSPYFQENFKPEKTGIEMRFPNTIWVTPASTSDNSVLGLNLIGAILDETNFMSNSKVDVAENLYSTVMRRMKSRFMRQGKMPGLLMLVSSKKTETDFTERRIKQAHKDPNIFVREHALYTVKPRHYFKPTTFKVLVGNEVTKSKVLEDEEEIKTYEESRDFNVIEIPTDFKEDFERDIDASLRDIAGIATSSIYPYIKNRAKIEECVDRNRQHPMSVVELNMEEAGGFIWSNLIKMNKSTKDYIPINHPDRSRHIHIDTSITGDSTGFAMGCVTGYVDVVRTGVDGTKYSESAPQVFIDLMIRIVPPRNGEIVFAEVRKLIYEISAHGFNIGMVSMDSYQSFDARQTLQRHGYKSEIVSVDTKLEPYEMLRDAIYDNRISYYSYEPFLTEIKRVEMDQKKKKVDHPPNESKDVSDSVAGIVYSLSQMYKGEPMNPFGVSMNMGKKVSSEYDWLGLDSIPITGDEDDFLDDIKGSLF